ncbi:hypothetical protein ABZ930_36590 [Streptomyces sp. NPDC046716]|uniref:hypothetical protein n=1 Tax=Streptomyces sp. NPDC046716 TaxID=3157093 RepID=UPI0033FDE757
MAPDNHLVTVTLSDCGDRDAHTVLSHLAAEFPDRSPAPDTLEAGGASPTVWTAEFDALADGPSTAPKTGPRAIDGSVSVTAQGAPNDVTTLRAALARAFTVDDEGSTSGDQELDSRFRVTARKG